jgi:hypothetical protein
MEKKIKIQHLLLILFMIPSKLFAQEVQPLEPKDRFSFDLVKELVFQNTNQIIEFFKGESYDGYPYIQIEELYIKHHHIPMLLIERCFGLPCQFIYIFKEKEDQLVFVEGLSLRFPGKIDVKIDNEEEKIIFGGMSSQLVTDTTNINGKDIYEKTVKGKKMLFEKIFEKIAEIPFEAFLDLE